MAVVLSEVFIASSFEEFAPLRAEIKRALDDAKFARAIDLNDNAADPRSALQRSRAWVRKADALVLLAGERYGSIPDGQQHSYTHLEYKAACAEGVPVIAYFVGAAYGNRERRPRDGDQKLNPLQRDLFSEVTVGFHDTSWEPEALAERVVADVRQALDAPEETEARDDDETALGDAAPSDHLDEFERESGVRDSWASERELLERPAEAAAAEQLHEAKRARAIHDRGAAVHHLRKALELRPLDLGAGYLLARLLVASPRVRDLHEASKLARRVARLAEVDGSKICQGLALAVAATAEARLDNEDRTIELARQAVDAADRIAAVHIECASAYARIGRVDQAIKEADRAFRLHPSSFWKLRRDPAIKRTPEFRALARQLRDETRAAVTEILGVERDSRELERLLSTESAADAESGVHETVLGKLKDFELIQAVNCGKESARRTVRVLTRIARLLPAAKRVLDGLRREASDVASKRSTILTQPIRPLEPPIVDGASWTGPPTLGLFGSLLLGVEWVQGFTVVAVAFVSGLVLRSALRTRQRSARVSRELEANAKEAEQADRRVESAKTELVQWLDRFADLVQRFETHAISPPGGIFSPSVGTANAAVGRLVRLRSKSPPEDFDLDRHLFPPDSGLTGLVDERLRAKYQLFKVIRREGGGWAVARWGCYFD